MTMDNSSIGEGSSSSGSGGFIWIRSLLAVYRQAAQDASQEGIDTAARRYLMERLGEVHARLAAYEDVEPLWRDLGASEANIRTLFAPLTEAARACNPGTPIAALVEFAAEEMAFAFENTE